MASQVSGPDSPHSIQWDRLTKEADELLRELFPICRSITGDGVRQSLSILQEVAPFDVLEIPSGTECYDWVIPDEWNIRDAYVADTTGRKIIDFQQSNISIVSYSEPIDRKMSFQELEGHLYSLPDLPTAIPYRTSYYHRNWGFCLPHENFVLLDKDETYHVKIDSTLKPGSLTLGEAFVKGDSGLEFLISTYCCHPSLANDNLSGQVLWALLLRELQSWNTRNSYRFVIVPETIGAIAYLSRHEEALRDAAGGFVITSVAGPGQFGYKSTFVGDHLIDNVVHRTFEEAGLEYLRYQFDINGSDETHYSSPFFRIPMGTICKDKYYEYDYYHTSLDNLDFISARDLVETLKVYLSAVANLEMDLTYRSLKPHSEPMLSKRGLYPQVSGHLQQTAFNFEVNHAERTYAASADSSIQGSDIDAMLWVMFHSDGETTLLDISKKTGIPIRKLHNAGEILREKKLLETVEVEPRRHR